MEMHERHESPEGDEPYQQLLDEARTDLANESRERQRVLEQVQRESATFVGTLLDLAERQAPVSVRTAVGTTITGTVDLVGADVVQVGGTWLRTDAVTAVRATATGPATGDRAPEDGDITFQGVLERLAEDRHRVALHVDDGEPLRGELVAVGQDVLTLRLEGADRAVAYVPVAEVAGVRLTS